jgi:hypothetical protein
MMKMFQMPQAVAPVIPVSQTEALTQPEEIQRDVKLESAVQKIPTEEA